MRGTKYLSDIMKEIESAIPNDELSEMIDNDLKDLHKFLKFEEYYRNNKDKEE